MRIIVVFIILILLSAGIYTAYGILSFEPEKPAPLVFQEPSLEALRALGGIPLEKPDVPMSPEQQDRTKKAVEIVSDAMATYQQYEAAAPLRLKETIMTLTGAMGTGRLPAYFLSLKDAAHPARKFEMLQFDSSQSMETAGPQNTLNCTDKAYILMGADHNDTITCNAPLASGDRIIIGGPGNDIISDATGNRIVNAGAGDDTITLGPGRNIILLDEAWGHDTLTVDCKGAVIQPDEVPKDFAVPWVSKFTNFIILSPRIPKNSVRWTGKTLTNSQTGDTLNVNENCFTLIGQ